MPVGKYHKNIHEIERLRDEALSVAFRYEGSRTRALKHQSQSAMQIANLLDSIVKNQGLKLFVRVVPPNLEGTRFIAENETTFGKELDYVEKVDAEHKIKFGQWLVASIGCDSEWDRKEKL